jgi:uncharacterized membrane protein (DUF2068 family)
VHHARSPECGLGIGKEPSFVLVRATGARGAQVTLRSDVRPPTPRSAVRFVALVEALKGVVVLLAATGLLALVHEDLNTLAASLVEHTHLNPASRYPHIFLDAVSNLQQPRLLWIAAGAAVYAALRLVEGYRLFRGRAWVEWLAALSGALYVPLELLKVSQGPTPLGIGVLLANLAVVGVMVLALVQREQCHGRRGA